MKKTFDHIGKIARLEGNLTDFIDGDIMSGFGLLGITHVGMIQTSSPDGSLQTFAEIIGECDPSKFTEIMTKEEANALIRSWFVPAYEITNEWLFNRYVDMYLTADHLKEIDTDWTYQEVLKYLVEHGFKFIRMSTFNGPQFTIEPPSNT